MHQLYPNRQHAVNEALVKLETKAIEKQKTEGQQELSGDRRVNDTKPAKLGPAGDVRQTRDEGDHNRLNLCRDRQGDSLPRLRDEPLEVRPRDRSNVQANEDNIGIHDHTQTETV